MEMAFGSVGRRPQVQILPPQPRRTYRSRRYDDHQNRRSQPASGGFALRLGLGCPPRWTRALPRRSAAPQACPPASPCRAVSFRPRRPSTQLTGVAHGWHEPRPQPRAGEVKSWEVMQKEPSLTSSPRIPRVSSRCARGDKARARVPALSGALALVRFLYLNGGASCGSFCCSPMRWRESTAETLSHHVRRGRHTDDVTTFETISERVFPHGA